MTTNSPGSKMRKDQLKVQIDPVIHRLLRELCEKSRRTPAGQIEFMTLMFHKHGGEKPGTAKGRSGPFAAGHGNPRTKRGVSSG